MTKSITFDGWGSGVNEAEKIGASAPCNTAIVSQKTMELTCGLYEMALHSPLLTFFLNNRFLFEENETSISGFKTYIVKRK